MAHEISFGQADSGASFESKLWIYEHAGCYDTAKFVTEELQTNKQ